MRLMTLLTLSWFSFFSCNSTKYTTPVDYPQSVISFGSGGGFTGFITEYNILDNGQVFKKISNETEFTPLNKIKKSQIQQLFESAKTLDLESIDFNETGNMNSFLKIKTDKQSYEINWGVPGPKPPANAKLFYDLLMNIVKRAQS